MAETLKTVISGRHNLPGYYFLIINFIFIIDKSIQYNVENFVLLGFVTWSVLSAHSGHRKHGKFSRKVGVFDRYVVGHFKYRRGKIPDCLDPCRNKFVGNDLRLTFGDGNYADSNVVVVAKFAQRAWRNNLATAMQRLVLDVNRAHDVYAELRKAVVVQQGFAEVSDAYQHRTYGRVNVEGCFEMGNKFRAHVPDLGFACTAYHLQILANLHFAEVQRLGNGCGRNVFRLGHIFDKVKVIGQSVEHRNRDFVGSVHLQNSFVCKCVCEYCRLRLQPPW